MPMLGMSCGANIGVSYTCEIQLDYILGDGSLTYHLYGCIIPNLTSS